MAAVHERGQRDAVADRQIDHVWHGAAELLPDFERDRLLGLHRQRVAGGVAVVPAEPLAGFVTEAVGRLVGGLHQEDSGPKRAHVRHLRGGDSPS
jgi:hypothetical protein